MLYVMNPEKKSSPQLPLEIQKSDHRLFYLCSLMSSFNETSSLLKFTVSFSATMNINGS